ncbi:hypothetical protein BDZ88DRAFT_428992 [Geranomyces variabilis]|nr:hypothetical protein BDZ88DRAFT_428992 [Geranomyces variabilis]
MLLTGDGRYYALRAIPHLIDNNALQASVSLAYPGSTVPTRININDLVVFYKYPWLSGSSTSRSLFGSLCQPAFDLCIFADDPLYFATEHLDSGITPQAGLQRRANPPANLKRRADAPAAGALLPSSGPRGLMIPPQSKLTDDTSIACYAVSEDRRSKISVFAGGKPPQQLDPNVVGTALMKLDTSQGKALIANRWNICEGANTKPMKGASPFFVYFDETYRMPLWASTFLPFDNFQTRKRGKNYILSNYATRQSSVSAWHVSNCS